MAFAVATVALVVWAAMLVVIVRRVDRGQPPASDEYDWQ